MFSKAWTYWSLFKKLNNLTVVQKVTLKVNI